MMRRPESGFYKKEGRESRAGFVENMRLEEDGMIGGVLSKIEKHGLNGNSRYTPLKLKADNIINNIMSHYIHDEKVKDYNLKLTHKLPIGSKCVDFFYFIRPCQVLNF